VAKYAQVDWPASGVAVHSSFTELAPQPFVNLLMSSKFCVCVHGGGIDPSPKCFEAILLGCIPIIERSTLDGAYSRYPVAYVDEWTPECINPKQLSDWLQQLESHYTHPLKRAKVLEMMQVDYWMREIEYDTISQKQDARSQTHSCDTKKGGGANEGFMKAATN